MACRKFYFIVILIITMSLFILPLLDAQESISINETENTAAEETEESGETEENLNYYLDRSQGEPRFIQRLFWIGDEYALRYVLIVQRRGDDGLFTEAERVDTEQTIAEVSLTAGRYRYSVEVYDLFDEYAFTTDWREFTVIRAIQPYISGFSPNHFYLDEEENWVITVRGNNFLPETVFNLVQNNSRITPARIELADEGTTARLQFSGASFFPGKFDMYARNPGGLDHSLESFTVSNRKRFDFNISFGYAPVVPVYGYLFEDGFIYEDRAQEAPFPDRFFPLSAAARVSFLPIKRTWGNIGVDLSGSFSFLNSERSNYSTEAYLINGHASLLYQIHFFKRTFYINFHAGGGIFYIVNFFYDFGKISSETTANSFISAIGGLSFTYIFKKPMFVSLGADFIQAFTPKIDVPMPAIIRPFASFGVQL